MSASTTLKPRARTYGSAMLTLGKLVGGEDLLPKIELEISLNSLTKKANTIRGGFGRPVESQQFGHLANLNLLSLACPQMARLRQAAEARQCTVGWEPVTDLASGIAKLTVRKIARSQSNDN